MTIYSDVTTTQPLQRTREDKIDAVARLLNGDDRADRAVAWLLASRIVDTVGSTTAEEKVLAGLALASQIESEAMHSYRQPPDRLDPIVTVRRIRIALGLERPT